MEFSHKPFHTDTRIYNTSVHRFLLKLAAYNSMVSVYQVIILKTHQIKQTLDNDRQRTTSELEVPSKTSRNLSKFIRDNNIGKELGV